MEIRERKLFAFASAEQIDCKNDKVSGMIIFIFHFRGLCVFLRCFPFLTTAWDDKFAENERGAPADNEFRKCSFFM